MQTIDRAMLIIRSFSAKDNELSLAELHRKLGLSKSSLQRILNSLVFHGLLEKDEKRKVYKLGIELYFLGQLVERNSHLLSISKPFMEELRDELGESIALNILHQNERKCIAYLEGKHELTTLSYVGQTSPLYAGASAKVLLAFLPTEEVNGILDEIVFSPISKNTILSKERLKKELNKIKEEGYSVSFEERVAGAFSISAPIFNRFNEIIAAVTISAPTVRIDNEKIKVYINHVKMTANLISNQLDY